MERGTDDKRERNTESRHHRDKRNKEGVVPPTPPIRRLELD